MPAFICTACGTQYSPSEAPPPACTICQDERQYVPPRGQTWTTLDALAVSYRNAYHQYEPGILGIGTEPHFAIGQRAILVCTPHGNVLWDTISMLDPATVTLIEGLGGLAAIGISHPHFYTSMVEWSRAFGDVPIHLHAADREWIMRPDPAIKLWDGETLALLPDVTLVRCGGHFPGGTVLHWSKGAGDRGHGNSGWASDYSIGRHVLDVSAVVAHFGWTRVHLVGMSLGGVIAAHYAASAASGAASLTMVDVGPKPDFEATAAMRNFMSRSITDLTLDQLVEAAVRGGARGSHDTILYRYLHMTRIGPDGRLTRCHDNRSPHDYAHILDKIQELNELAPAIACKILITRGERSRILTDEKVAAFAARFRHGWWVAIPEAGHNIQEDNPMALATTLGDFLR